MLPDFENFSGLSFEERQAAERQDVAAVKELIDRRITPYLHDVIDHRRVSACVESLNTALDAWAAEVAAAGVALETGLANAFVERQSQLNATHGHGYAAKPEEVMQSVADDYAAVVEEATARLNEAVAAFQWNLSGWSGEQIWAGICVAAEIVYFLTLQ